MADSLQKRMVGAGDNKSAALLRQIEVDELEHVRYGVKWFRYFTARDREKHDAHERTTPESDGDEQGGDNNNEEDVKAFHALVRDRFDGSLLPPFSQEARAQAGMTSEWYFPLAEPKALAAWQDKLARVAKKKEEAEQRRLERRNKHKIQRLGGAKGCA
jgi:hypothetical protein